MLQIFFTPSFSEREPKAIYFMYIRFHCAPLETVFISDLAAKRYTLYVLIFMCSYDNSYAKYINIRNVYTYMI